jgi:hypothetical protein
MRPYNWRQDYDWTDPDDYPVEDDKMFDVQSEEELMLPHEIKAPGGIESLGPKQASGIDPNINIEVVVEEFIKRKGRRPRSIEEIKEFYLKEMAGGSGEPQRVAYEPGNYDPIMVDEYERYKYEMNEQKPGFPVMEIDEFIQMQQEPKMGAAGGLSGILGA